MTENVTRSQSFFSETEKGITSEKKAMTRAAGIVGIWTALSRILGFIRDTVTAYFLGAGFGSDAFFMAFRIPNLLRRVFAEGALSAAFVPTFVETLQDRGREESARLARITLTFAALVLLTVTLMGIVFSSEIVHLIAPGFAEDPKKFQLTVELTRIMFPYIFFISLVALASGILNSMGYFAAPAAAPMLLNISMIFGVAVFTVFFKIEATTCLAWGVVVAGVLQLALQIPFLSRSGVKMRPDFHFKHPALKRIGILFIPAALSGAVYQINVLVGSILASKLQVGGVSWLYYADRLVELPLGVFGIALGTAVLPSMSRQAANGDLSGLSKSVSFALRFTAFFTIPASVGLIMLREPIISVLFQRGLFSAADTRETAVALLYYTVGLWAFSGLKVIVQAFFSLKDTRTPLWVSIVAVFVNLGAGLILMGPMKQGGLALATSLAAAFNVLVLFIILVKRLGFFPSTEFVSSIARVSAASAIMGVFLMYAASYGEWSLALTKYNISILAGCILGGIAVFGLSAWIFRCTELRSLMRQVRPGG